MGDGQKRPSPEIFMPTMGVGNKEAVEERLSEPFAATLKVLIWPLLDAIRKWPSGVAASEMPAQLSSVRPLEKGDPAIAVRAPVAGVMRKTLIVLVTAVGDKKKIAGQVGRDSVNARTCNRGPDAAGADRSNEVALRRRPRKTRQCCWKRRSGY